METVKNRIVIKVGTSTITTETGENNFRTMDKLAQVLLLMRAMRLFLCLQGL